MAPRCYRLIVKEMRSKIAKIPFWLVLSFLHSFALAQHPVYYQFTEEDGLPDVEFYDVIQDSQGFFWFAANNGLFRYDGKSFKNYNHPGKRGLSVFNLSEDANGNIWCVNISGQLFRIQKDSLTIAADLNPSLTIDVPDYLIKDNGDMLITSLTGLFTFKKGVLEKVKYERQTNRLRRVTQLHRDIYLIEGDNKLLRFREGKIETICDSISSYYHFNIEKTTRGTYLVGWSSSVPWKSQVSHFDEETKKITVLQLPEKLANSKILSITSDSHDSLWMCTSRGGYQVTVKANAFHITKELLPEIFVTKIIEDHEKNLWLTTLDNGIFFIPDLDVISYALTVADSKKSGIKNLVKDHLDSVFYISKDSIFGKVRKSGLSPLFKVPAFYVNDLKYNTASNQFYAYGDRIIVFDKQMAKTIDSDYLNTIKAISLLPDNRVLVSNNLFTGIISEQFSGLQLSDIKILRGNRSYANYYSHLTHTIYVSYVDGVFSYKDGSSTEIQFRGNNIYALGFSETSDSTIWIATFNHGVLGVKNNQVVYEYNTSNGLQSNEIVKIMADDDRLWVVHKSGLQRIDRPGNTITTIDRHDGLNTYSISDIEIANGYIYLATPGGIISMPAAKDFTNTISPTVYLESFSVSEVELPLKNSYALDFDNENIRISFNSTSFSPLAPEKQFQYKLEGIDNDWVLTTSGFARYPSLPDGTYTFKVKALNEDGISSTKPATVVINVALPLWKEWWFILLVVVILGFTVYLETNKVLKRKEVKRRQQQEKREIEQSLIISKLTALRSQMNPHFLFNALNSIQEHIITNQRDLASDYLGKFADLMRVYLDQSRLNSITLEEEVHTLSLYLDLEKMRFEENFEYHIHTAEVEEKMHMHIPTLLIQPYTENAIKHGLLHKRGLKKLDIYFKLSSDNKDVLTCFIEDNGVGRVRSMQINASDRKNHRSFALEAGKSRLELLNYGHDLKIGVTIEDLYDKNTGNATGTRVVLRVPLSVTDNSLDTN